MTFTTPLICYYFIKLTFLFPYSLTLNNPDLLLYLVLKFLNTLPHFFLANIPPQSSLNTQHLLFIVISESSTMAVYLNFSLFLSAPSVCQPPHYFLLKSQPWLNSIIIYLLFSKAVLKHNRRAIWAVEFHSNGYKFSSKLSHQHGPENHFCLVHFLPLSLADTNIKLYINLTLDYFTYSFTKDE